MRVVFICRGCAHGGNTCVARACGGAHCVSSRDGESDCAFGCASSLFLSESRSPSDGRGSCGIVASRRECQRRGCVVCPNGRCFPQTLACCWAKCENAASFVAHAAFQRRSTRLESAISTSMGHFMETAIHAGGCESRLDSISGPLSCNIGDLNRVEKGAPDLGTIFGSRNGDPLVYRVRNSLLKRGPKMGILGVPKLISNASPFSGARVRRVGSVVAALVGC